MFKEKQLINKGDIISFDVFDTLLCRPYIKPTDLFSHLEKVEHAKGFAQERIDAEGRARKKLSHFSEINYDEIYDEIDDKFKHLKEKEFQLEKKILYVNSKAKCLFDYAVSKNKIVVITSDMYLRENQLAQILKEKGFEGHKKIYVSSEYRKNKHDCKLFEQILEDFNVESKKLLHIGDNKYADYLMAKKCNINAVHIENSREKFFKKYPRWQNLYEHNPDSLTISIVLGLLIKQETEGQKFNSYWEKLGYQIGGPVCYGLTKFMLNEINKAGIKEAIFVARDGYTLQKIFNMLQKGDIKNYYIYAPRIINLITNLEYENISYWKYQPMSIVNYYLSQSKELLKRKKGKLNDYNSCSQFIENNMDVIEPLRQKENENYKNYISQFNFNEKNIALLDISAGSFNSIKLLTRMLPEKHFYGLYWLVSKIARTKGIDFKDYQNSRYKGKLRENLKFAINYEMFEFLITAPELPVKMLKNNKPVYLKNKYETKRAKVYKIMSEMEVKFAENLKETFDGNTVDFSHDDLILFLNTFMENLSFSDQINLSQIYHGLSEDHKVYEPLINCAFKIDLSILLSKVRLNARRLKMLKFLFN